MRTILASVWVGVTGLGLIAPALAAPAPDIVGKSVTVSWTENREIRAGGATRSGPVSFQLSIYIGATGRPFARVTASSRVSNASGEQVGGSGTSLGGGVRSVRVDGHAIAVQSNFGNYARSTRVNLGPGGASCSVQIVVGKEVGSAPKAFQVNGTTIEVLSTTVSSSSCSAQDGNVFAH